MSKNAEVELKTPDEWCRIKNCRVLDPDGWRSDYGELKAKSWDKLISYPEFIKRYKLSTIKFNGYMPELKESLMGKTKVLNPYTIVTVMNGMNRFHQRDDEHPFYMSALDGYNTLWLPQVQEIEKTHSTLYYEALRGIETARAIQENDYLSLNVSKDNYIFIFGRGTIGPASEECLFEAMQQCMKYYGKDVNFVMVAKSFGVADTLAALKMFSPYHRKPCVNGLFLIDGFLPPSEKRKIAKRVGKHRRFIIPKFVNRHYNVIQKEKGTKGRLVVTEDMNYTVTQTYVDKVTKFYKGYKDGHERRLLVSHSNMEEIVSAVPCIRINEDFLKLADAIGKTTIHFYPPKRK